MLKNKLFTLLLLGSISLPIWAESTDYHQPINIQAMHATFNQKSQVSLFTGQVLIQQGTMQLSAHIVKLHKDRQGYQYATGNGDPIRFKQKMNNSADYLEAQALRFTYDGKTKILTLYDKAWIKRGLDEIKSDCIIYDLNQETYEAQTKMGSPVVITILPKPEKPASIDHSTVGSKPVT